MGDGAPLSGMHLRVDPLRGERAGAIRVRYELSQTDYDHYVMWINVNAMRSVEGYAARRRVAKISAVSGASLLLLSLVTLRGDVVISIMMLVLSAICLRTAWMHWRRLSPERAEELVKRSKVTKMNVPPTFELSQMDFDETGFQFVTQGSVTVSTWELVARIVTTPDLLMVWLCNNSVHMVPVRAFADREVMMKAGAQLTAWLDASGHGDAHDLRAYLRQNPTQCPFCDSALDAEHLCCGWCQEPVTRMLVPQAIGRARSHPPTVPGRVEG